MVRLLNETIYILSGEVLRDGGSSKEAYQAMAAGSQVWIWIGHPAKNRKYTVSKKLAGINARPTEESKQNVKGRGKGVRRGGGGGVGESGSGRGRRRRRARRRRRSARGGGWRLGGKEKRRMRVRGRVGGGV